jgi:hypothetical protein
MGQIIITDDGKMRRNVYLWNIACFMIFLIITLPIYSASGYAATINSIDAYGSAGISGFRGLTDTTTINVSVLAAEDTSLGGNQVKILEDPTALFTCAVSDNTTGIYSCTKEYASMTVSSAVTVTQFTVQVFSDSGSAITIAQKGAITVDSVAPKVVSVNYAPQFGSSVVTASFTILDEACESATCAGLCSGISSMKFTVSGLSVGQNASFDSNCRQTGTINLTGLAVGGEVGKKRVCMELVDKMNQTSTTCSDVTIDMKMPEILGIGLYDINNKPVLFHNALPQTVKLKINITETSKLIDPLTGAEGYIRVNASSLSERPEHKPALENKALLCTDKGNNISECIFDGFYLALGSQKSASIDVWANDSQGNVLKTSRTLPLTFDNAPPVGTKIYSSYADDKGAYWIDKENNTIMMSVTEATSGMAKGQVFLDFSGFGPQKLYSGKLSGASTSLVYPNNCTGGSGGWTCNWHGISTNQASGTTLYLSPQAQSADDANNLFGSPLPRGALHVDIDPPKVDKELLNLSNITGIGSGHDPMTNLTSGDALEIHLFVKDLSGIKSAVANLSALIDDSSTAVAGSCSENQALDGVDERIYECTWSTGAIKNGYLNNLKIDFTFEDYAGHTGIYTWNNIEILAAENTAKQRWTITVPKDGISPSNGIDRLSWGLASQRIYYKLKFEKVSGVEAMTSIKFDPKECAGVGDWVNQDPESGEYTINRMGFATFKSSPDYDIMVIELNPGNVPEYYETNAKKQNVSVDKVYVNCSFTIQSIVKASKGGRALSLPEEVNVSFEIPVYNNPLGSNIGNIKDKIKEDEDYVSNGAWKFVYYTKLILSYARELCRFIETYISLMMMWAGLKDMWSAACNTEPAPPAKAGCGSATIAGKTVSGMALATNDFMGELYFFCGLFISCRLSKNAKAAMEGNCGTDTGNWCKVKKAWASVNGWWAELGSLNLKNALGKGPNLNEAGQVETNVIVPGTEKKDASGKVIPGTGQKTKEGVNVFSVDDFDPTRSMASSILSGCLPGLMVNLDKLRQIRCKRLLCYKIDVPGGVPMKDCDMRYSYEHCTFVRGQVMAAIPLLQYVEQVGQFLMSIIRQPLSFLIGFVLDKGCAWGLCGNPKFLGCKICITAQYALSLASIIADLAENTGARFSEVSFDMCEEALKEKPSYDNIEWPGTGKRTSAEDTSQSETAPKTTTPATA